MGKTSRDKGARGERELANHIKKYGYDTKRAQQHCGAAGDCDVLGLPGIHIECKRTEKLSLYEAMEQASSDCGEENIPAVFHRRNRKPWLVVIDIETFMDMYGCWAEYKGLI